MRFLKSLLRGLFSLIFKLSLTLLLVIAPVVMVLGTSGQIKQSLQDSKIYDSAVDSLVDNIKKDADNHQDPNQKDDSPFAEAAVQDALKKAVTPAFLQSSSEQIIDGMYGWLQGKTAQPEFKIDISGVKKTFTDAVGDYAVNRGKTLPACTVAQARQALADGKVEPLTTPCLPAGYSLEDLRGEITKQLNTPKPGEKDNLLQHNEITPDTLPAGDDGQNPIKKLTTDAGKAPQIFHWLTLAPLLLGALAVASGGLVLALHDEKRRGLRQLAWTLLPLGVLGLLSVFLTNFALNKLEHSGSLIKADNALKEPLITLIHSLTSAFNHSLLLLAGVYVVLGAGTLIVLKLTAPKEPKVPLPTDHKPIDPDNPVLPEPVSESDQKPPVATSEKSRKPKKTLIQ